ncbi:MAG: FAD-dependent oxidoreductase, partial [Burkholderiales bacterium]
MSGPLEILLLGGGHAHLTALEPLARAVAGRASIALLAPSEKLLYSGMMPGWIAGQYRFEQCAIPLRRWCEAAGVRWIEDRVVDIAFPDRRALGASGRSYRYDLVSINVGSENALGEVDAAVQDRVLGAKPFARFVDRWQAGGRFGTARRCLVVGGGAAGVELALALRAAGSPEREVTLLGSGTRLLEGMATGAARRARAALAARRIRVRLGARYLGASAGGLALADGSAETFDIAIVATGARPPGWLGACALRDAVSVAADGGLA